VTPSPPRALVTGITGQDGSFLAERLLDEGFEVWGLVRGGEDCELGLVTHLRDRLRIIRGELLVPDSLERAVRELRPDELYHLAAPSFVPDSWRHPARSAAAIVTATATLLEAVRDHSPSTRFLLAASGEIFGEAGESPQTESTAPRPVNPYAIAKLAAHQLVGRLREQAGVFACSAIMYNHESERRPPSFVTRKITQAAAAIKLGQVSELVLGDTSAVRDWSFAGDVVAGATLMLRHDTPADYILASGVGRTVRDLLEVAFAQVGIDPDAHVRIDPQLVRAPETTARVGDPARAHMELGWRPTVSFEQLVARMVDADLRELGA
jgi:GDPmannose 4,6-dehydratase